MGAFFFVAFVAGIIAVTLWASEKELRETNDAWEQAAAGLGAKFKRAKLAEQRSIEGKVRDCTIEVSEVPQGKGVKTRFEVLCRGIPTGLALRGEGGAAGLKKLFTGEDVQLGDPPFDAMVNVTGPEDTALAALGHQARRALYSLCSRESSAKVACGTVTVEKPGKIRSGPELARLAEELIELAHLLRVTSVSEALAWNARMDAVAGSRLRNLTILARDYPGSAALAEAAASALGDSDARVKLAAARAIGGDRERDVLESLIGRSEGGPEIRVAALERLVETRPYQEVARHVALVLRSHEPKELRAAIVAAASGRDASAVERLCTIAESKAPEVAAAAAASLGEIGDPRAQATLVKLLSYESAEMFAVDVRQRAAVALGRLGTIEAVEPLLPLAHAVLPGAVRDAARDAVRAIQSRLGEAGAGRLSVVGTPDAAAGLSLVEEVGAGPSQEEPAGAVGEGERGKA